MSYSRTLARLVLMVFGSMVIACSGDGTSSDVGENGVVDDPDTPKPTVERSVAEEGVLAGVCPDPLVIQTDWFPQSEYGALYHLIGDGYHVDTDRKVVRGPMVLDGVDLGIEFEIRSGGPSLGGIPVSSHMYSDKSIHLGYVSTDIQILQWADAPLVSVVAPLEKNPQIIMWDPETYPDVETVADLKDQDITVNVSSVVVYPDIFVAQGIWSADQVDRSYKGSPARFITEGGAIAQQGFASSEVYTYEHVHENWGRPVDFQLIHDAGLEIYSQTLGVTPENVTGLRSCLELVVPIIQQAVISYIAAPGRANTMIVDVVERFDTFWVYQSELADFSVQTQKDYGLVGNGSDATVGNMEAERVKGVLDAIRATEHAGRVPEDLSIEDLYTDQFIDFGIGFP